MKVLLNGKLISQKRYGESLTKGFSPIELRSGTVGGYTAKVMVGLDPNGQAMATVTDIKLQGNVVVGDMVLVQNAGQLMGLRTYFGLAPIPVSGNYQLGGFANLSILQPTAGREALSRESIVHVHNLVSLAEKVMTELVAGTDAADRNNAFLQHVLTLNRLDLAGKVTIAVQPNDLVLPLAKVAAYCKGKKWHYYAGTDNSIIKTFAGPELWLLQVSQSNPRRKLQLRYVTQELSVPEVPDKATILKVFSPSELFREEAAFLARVMATLSDDYLLVEVSADFAEISHSVPIKFEKLSLIHI